MAVWFFVVIYSVSCHGLPRAHLNARTCVSLNFRICLCSGECLPPLRSARSDEVTPRELLLLDALLSPVHEQSSTSESMGWPPSSWSSRIGLSPNFSPTFLLLGSTSAFDYRRRCSESKDRQRRLSESGVAEFAGTRGLKDTEQFLNIQPMSTGGFCSPKRTISGSFRYSPVHTLTLWPWPRGDIWAFIWL